MATKDKNRPASEKEAAATYYTAMNPPPNNDNAPASVIENEDIVLHESTTDREMADENMYEPTPGQRNMGAGTSFKVSQTSKAHPYEEFTASRSGRQDAVTSKLDEEIKKDKIESTTHKRFLCMLITLVVAALVIVACFIAVFVEVAALKSQSEMTSAQLQSLSISLMQDPMSTSGDLVSLQQLNNSIYSLDNRATEQINGIEESVTTPQSNYGPCNFNERLRQIENAVNNNSTNISPLQEEHLQFNASLYDLMRMLENQVLLYSSLATSISSCAALPPSSPSGYYWVSNSKGSAVRVYCDMTRSCGGITGGWTRVAELDTTSNGHQCPSGLTQRTDGAILTCVRDTSTAGCSSVTFPTEGISYSRACGRITGYQIGSPDGFHRDQSIDFIYVDGIILTYGDPRQHIWTFAVGLDRQSSVSVNSCPCQVTPSSAILPPSFVGNDYFCDAGLSLYTESALISLENVPLWTNASCLCCTNPPWFHKQLPQPTTDDIEMRVCRDEGNNNEDIALQLVEIYIQ